MALNIYEGLDEIADDIIGEGLADLVGKLNKMGLSCSLRDIECQFLSREEYIYIPSDKLYPEEDLPGRFGVYRGYSGGGIHSSTMLTEIDRMSKRRQAKAQKALALFEKAFWHILEGMQAENEAADEENAEPWNRLTI